MLLLRRIGTRSPGKPCLRVGSPTLIKTVSPNPRSAALTRIPHQDLKRWYCQSPAVTTPSNVTEEILTPTFRGISQMVFLENAASGCGILGAITAASPTYGAILFSGSLLSVIFGRLLNTNPADISSGLICFNGILVGFGLATFTGIDWTLPPAIIAATFAAVVLYDQGSKLATPTRLPILSLPFIMVTYIALALKPSVITFSAPDIALGLHLSDPLTMLYNTITTVPLTLTQCFFTQSLPAGIAIFCISLLTNYKVALSGAGGAAIGLFTGMALGFDVTSGMWGFNSALTAMCLYPTFGKPWWSAILGASLAAFTYPLALSFFGGYGMPALSWTFVGSTIVCLLGFRLAGR